MFDSRWFWAITLLGVVAMVIRNPLVRYGASMTIANIAIAMIIVRCAARPQSRVSRMFERRSLVWIGTLSYSLYLWQQLFLNQLSLRIGGGTEQIQKNVLGERVLGLPGEPRPDKTAPFRDLPRN